MKPILVYNLNMVFLPIVVFMVTASLATLSSGSAIKSQPASHLMFDFNLPEPDFKIRQFPHEKYCHYFYFWESKDLFTIRKCPKGEIFDYHSHECKEKKQAQCWSHHYGKSKEHDHIHSKLKVHEFDCPYSSGKYPDVVFCENFFVCRNGVPQKKHCPPTKLFDRIRRYCVAESVALCADLTDAEDIHHRCPKPSGKFGHSKDCSRFYDCKHGEPTLRVCPTGELFNEVEKYCTKDEVLCGNRSIPVTTTKGQTTFGNLESSTLPSSEPLKNVSEIGVKRVTKTEKPDSNVPKSQSFLPTLLSVMQTTISDIEESSLSSKNLSNVDVKVTEWSEKNELSVPNSTLST